MTFLPAVPKLTERRFMKQVVDLAELLRWRVWHDNATNQRETCRSCRAPLACAQCGTRVGVVRNAAGFLDLVLVRRPRVLFVELKSDRGKVTEDQYSWLIELRECGVETFIWRPSDWPKIERILR